MLRTPALAALLLLAPIEALAQQLDTFAVTNVTVGEAVGASRNLTFNVTLQRFSCQSTCSVQFTTQNGSATAGADYGAASGTLTFPPPALACLNQSQQVNITIVDDNISEPHETLNLNISNVTGSCVIGDNSGLGTINNDDLAFLVNDPSGPESGVAAPPMVPFTISLQHPSVAAGSVSFQTSDGTAVAGVDYNSATGNITIQPPNTSFVVFVGVIPDLRDEADETINFNLFNPQGGTILDNLGVGRIIDDDAPPSANISDNRSIVEGNAGTSQVTYTVTLSAPSGRTISIDWDTVDVEATAGLDYVAGNGTLVFPAGSTTQTLQVTINGDLLDENDESFNVLLSNPVNVTLADGNGLGQILDDDNAPTISINDVTVTEGNTNQNVNAVFTVSLSAASGRVITVLWQANDVSAVAGADYIDGAGILTIPAGQPSVQLPIVVTGDIIDEPNETFTVTLAQPSNATVNDGTGVGTINDNDQVPSASITDLQVNEGNTNQFTSVLFTVTLTNPSSTVQTIDWTTANGSATAGADYTAANGRLTFNAGVVSQSITVVVIGDILDEANETFLVNLSNPTAGVTIADAVGQGTILDDDAGPSISIDDVTVTEGNAGSTSATFTVRLSAPSGQTVTVSYNTTNQTAVAPGDFTAVSGVLTFTPGTVSLPLAVPVAGDLLDEINETYFVNLTNPINATIGDATGIGTINDNDAPPVISVNDPSVIEGNAGTTVMSFVVTLSAPSGRTVMVNWATTNGSAVAPGDYASTTGTLVFNPGIISLLVPVTVNGDILDEAFETLELILSVPSNATIGDGLGLGTINDDDFPPNLAISDVTLNEGNAGTTNAVFNVTLSAASGQVITVSFTTLDGSAVAGADYTTNFGTLVFNPGVTTMPVSVAVLGDLVDEADETFFVDLSNATNVSVTDNRGQATIIDDEVTPAITISDVTVNEGNGAPVTAVFTVSLSASSASNVTVDWASANGSAVAPGDYTAGSQTVIFTPGNRTQTISIPITGDTLDEANETFFINLTNATNAVIGDNQGLGTITDDDNAPALSISDVTVAEGNAGTVAVTFNVTLSAASGLAVSADFATADGTAVSPGDYAATGGSVIFTSGVTTRPITVSVVGDLIDENNEAFTVVLSNPQNASIADGSGTGSITDDDNPPTIAISDASILEGNAGTATLVFSVTLSAASGLAVGVDFATANGTASSGTDYVAANARLTFNPGITTLPVSVTINGDALSEANETVLVNLTAPANATIGDNQGTGTIIDDDAAPSLFISDVTVTEGNAGTVTATFDVQLTSASGQNITVDWATTNGSAVAPGDYTAGSGGLTFAPGTTSRPVAVNITGDTLDEANENFTVVLSNAVNAPIIDGQGVGTITDDDAPPAASIADVTVTEGNAGTTNAVFAVTLSAASGQTVTVDWATANGTAQAGSDYAGASGRLTFNSGITSLNVSVAVNGDVLDEANETFAVNLSAPVNVTIADGAGNGTITDDDLEPSISIDDVTVTEGNAGAVIATFTVSLSAASGRTVGVDFDTTNGTATAGTDYTAGNGTLSFNPGSTTRTISVSVTGDAIDELNETFFVDLTAPQNGTIADARGIGTISDDDLAAAISISDATVTEGNAGTVNASFVVTLSAPSGLAVSVDWDTANGTAVAPGDYAAGPGTLSFAAGVTTQTIVVAVAGDLLDELDETFTVNLSSPANAAIADGTGLGTIDDDDAPPVLSIRDATVTEGNTGTLSAVFDVVLSAASGRAVTVDFATSNGTAVAPGDFAAAAGAVSFAAGTTAQTISVAVVGDTIDEANETFNVTLSSPGNATIGDGTGLGTITDNDAPPSISIADVTVSEGNAGTVSAVFTLTLSSASGLAVSADYATANGTAVAPGDFAAAAGAVSFAAGATTQSISIAVVGDVLDEPNEAFTVNLTNPGNATLGDAQAVGTITDDDAAPSLDIADVAITEPNAGTASAVFTVTLSGASGQAITVDWDTANGSAIAPADYAAGSGALTFAPGATQQQITVAVAGDLIDEADETFTVALSNPTNGLIGDGSGTGTINDNDAPPALSIADVSVTEGNAGTVVATFNVTLSLASGRSVSVAYATSDGTATGADYQATSGTLTFNPGTTTLPISVNVSGDLLDELNETFDVDLSAPVNATIGDGAAVGTITDDDNPPAISIADASIDEGDAGTVSLIFDVSLSAPSGRTITVDYAAANGTAIAPGDYTAASGTLTFAPGATARTVTVVIAGDTLDEDNETLLVNLTNPAFVAIGDGQAIGTIVDNDAAPSLSIDSVAVTEGNAGTLDMVFDVTLSAPSGRAVTVSWATSNDTATAGSDYVAGSGALSFPAGTTARTVTVVINGDVIDEGNETFFVTLTNPVNAAIAGGQGIGTINDNDAPPSLSIANVSIAEGNAGSANLVLTVTLSLASGQTVSVQYATADQTATAGSDYTAGSGTLTFAAGVLTQTFTVPVLGDALDEVDETFAVNLTNATNAAIGDAQAIATITDDDAPPAISIADVTVLEGTAATTSAVFTVSLNAPSARSITVEYDTANGTAVAPGDYTAGSGTLTFAAGVASQTITVAVVADALDEANETFNVVLTNPVNATLADGTALGTITDDDAPPSITIADATVTEGNAGTVAAVFNLTLSGASGRALSVAYASANGTAVAPGDYAAASGTLTFATGVTSQTISVTVNADVVDEANETFTVALSTPVNVTIADGSGLGTITDDDGAPQLSIADISVTEGDAGSANAQLTVTLLPASGQAVTVSWATANGTAVAGTDYTAGSGNLTFPAGSTLQTFTVAVLGDVVDEANETFLVNLTNPVNATLADGQAAVTITDNDAPPALTIADASLLEGNAGSAAMTFTLTLSAASAQTITVDHATADQTATAADYTGGAGTVTFAPGITTRTISVNVTGDLLDEANETFAVNLTNGVNVTITDGEAAGTITDNDAPPSIAIADRSITEGNAVTVDALFDVTLSAPSGQTITVQWATADGTAVAPGDYSASSGTLTFAPGVVSRTIPVPVNGDTTSEIDETFQVVLTAPVNATLGDGQATGTITNDDGAPSLSITDASVTEGNTGTVQATFNVSLSAPSGQTITVQWATSNGTAIAPADYAAGSGTLTFAPGTTAQALNVAVAADLLDEPNETFNVTLSNPTNALIADGTGAGTINDDDAPPSISIADATLAEGNAGSSNVTLTVTLSAASGRTVSVAYATADGSALSGSDYTAGSGTLTFAAGVLTRTFTVAILGDATDEPNEQLMVNLSAPTNAVIGDNQAVVTITDDDGAPSLSIADVTVAEGNAGQTSATFTITLSAASGQQVSVAYATANGTASAPGDFTARTGTAVFAAGSVTQTVVVSVAGDTLDEANETFTVNLTNPINATIGDAQATGTITDDDAPPTLSIADASVAEGDTGSISATFVVTLSAQSGLAASVAWATQDQTALAGTDYAAGSGTLAFAAGVTTQSFTVMVNGDQLDELDETFAVQLSAPTNAAIGDGTAAASIIDDDQPPSLSIADAGGDEADGTMSFTVSLSAPSGLPISIDFLTLDGNALAGSDYQQTDGTLTFLPGEISQAVDVTIDQDALDEEDETFSVQLTNAINSTTADALSIGTIADDDLPPAVSIADADAVEGNAGSSNGSLLVTLSAPSGLPIQVSYATRDDSALAGLDYHAASGTLDFPPGSTEQTIVVPILGDVGEEPDESLLVALTSATNATIADGEASLTILDDDLAPDLALTVTAGDFTVGAQGTYTIRVENVGAGPTIGPIALTDGLPSGLVLSQSSGDFDCSEEGGLLTCSSSVALDPSDALDLELTFDVLPEAFPEVVHTATVATPGDLFPENDAVPLATRVIGLADLAIQKTRPDMPADPGTEITWTIAVTNLGPNAVDQLFVVDQLPATISGAAFTPSAGQYDSSTGLITGIVLREGESVELIVAGLLAETSTGTLVNRAFVSVAEGWFDPDEANDQAVHRAGVSGGDCDADGLSDEQERELGTDECNPDTDGDGILDGTEVNGDNPTDPRDPDSDNDGLCDGSKTVEGTCVAGEDLNDNGRRDPNETDPNDEDTDDGGIPDGEEVALGLNPLDKDDDINVGAGCDCSATDPGTGGLDPLLALGLLLLLRVRRRGRSGEGAASR